jgi:hypothetical protein
MYNRILFFALFILVSLFSALGWYWSQEPGLFDVRIRAEQHAGDAGMPIVTGSVSTSTLISVAETLLNKPGGYISNDIMPPGVMLDNISNWEFGVVVQIRDYSRALRTDMSRSQSQSTADPDLEIAEPQFHFANDSWLFPSTEGEYEEGIAATAAYLRRLSDGDAQFYARADNLSDWLKMVQARMGSLSQRLSASVGQHRINTDQSQPTENGGDLEAMQQQGQALQDSVMVKTPWLEIDDVFYEARGTTWALIHLLKAAEIDFAPILANKNAAVSLRQIIRELEATQQTVWSPMILNGSGFGFFANHSLVLASYISRANAALIDLSNLLAQG